MAGRRGMGFRQPNVQGNKPRLQAETGQSGNKNHRRQRALRTVEGGKIQYRRA